MARERRLRLGYWRARFMLTQTRLAEKASMSERTIIALEKPDHRPPRISTVRKLATVLELN